MEEDLIKLDALFDSIIDEITDPSKAGTFVNPFKEQKINGIAELAEGITVTAIKISSDGMTATANVMSKSLNPKPFKADDIMKAASENGVFYGIDEVAVNDMAERQLINTDVVIAFGIQPVEGTDGKLHLRFDVAEGKDIPNVAKDAEICHIISPHAGRDGKDVCGRVVTAKSGANADFTIGEGLYKKGTRIYAEYSGTLVLRDGVYSIVDEMIIDKNVDQSSGIIEYSGTIIINGDVTKKAVIRAGRDIVIHGTAVSAVIEAGKDVHIGGRVSDASISAKEGNITGTEFYSATLVSGGSINASVINECAVKCVTGISCMEGYGRLSGGEIHCVGDINCITVGAREHIETHIFMGESDEFAEEMAKLEKKVSKLDNEIAKINDQVNRIREKEKSGTATLDEEGFLEAAIRIRTQKAAEKNPLTERIKKLSAIVDISKKATLRAKTVIYGGTILNIGGFSQIINSDRQHASVYSNGTNIVIT